MLGKDIKYLCVLFYAKKFENMKSYKVCKSEISIFWV